ncbi:MAG: aspartate kinase [Flavobacteriaceae bacterium]|nr:MAG: aspartate kinase [Flavobacteriaceae bacterium]
MKVFKFGGASVKDAASVKNLAKVIEHQGIDDKLIIISAMGKMTNAFEKVVAAYLHNKIDLENSISFVESFHNSILNDLFDDKKHPSFLKVEDLFKQLNLFLKENTSKDYNYIYDQIVPFGELLSTTIVSEYLSEINIKNNWIDVRNFIKTDASYRDAKVDWETTERNIKTNLDTSKLNITQGFLGGNANNTTTLGREGSDFTAAIFAYCLNAESVTIWKDVEGVLNADPRKFDDTTLLNYISYKEAIEMAFYGASVIHPKTLKPLENKLIPLVVRSFENLNSEGTKVSKGEDLVPKIPCFIQKENQILVSISALDFSFILEHNLSDIFQHLHKFKLKVNLIQNSALSFSMCIEDKFNRFDDFYNEMHHKYKVSYNENVTLFTIRHFDAGSLSKIEKNNSVLLRQTSRETVQIVTE